MAEKFGIGSLGLGGLPGVMDTMELMRKTWTQFSVPSSFAPTMDVDELDKRIADLKAVEQWLNLNLSMLHGTIQAMEIQRGTLAALKAFGESLGEAGAGAQAAASALSAMPAAMARGRAEDAASPARPPRQDAPEPAATASAARSPGAGTPPPAAGAPNEQTREPAQDAAAASGTPGRMAKGPPGGDDAGLTGLPGLAAGLSKAAASAVSPSAWWNMLQSQFNQVAQAAMSGAGLAGAADTPESTPRVADASPAPRGKTRASPPNRRPAGRKT